MEILNDSSPDKFLRVWLPADLINFLNEPQNYSVPLLVLSLGAELTLRLELRHGWEIQGELTRGE